MADAIALYFAALLLMAGGVVLGAVVRRGRRREPERLRRQLRALDSYIEQVSEAESVAELDRLENDRNGDL